MKKLCVNLVVSTLSLWLVSLLMEPNMYIGSFKDLLSLSIVLAILNLFLKPILKFCLFPINVLSLGLFSFVINAVVLKIAFALIPGVALTGLVSAILSSILISISNCILNAVLN